jgi:CxxC motif-containing protein (DUF1111 family)
VRGRASLGALALATAFAARGDAAGGVASGLPAAALTAGATTIQDTGRDAFSFPARNLREEHRADFFVGNSFFNENWIAAPASVATRDGLGPLFNVRSCSGCHFKDGRGRPPEEGEPLRSMLLRISVPGAGPHGGPRPHPIYGDQIQGMAIPGVPAEADVLVTYEPVGGAFPDGTRWSLRRPRYRLERLGYGPAGGHLMISPRVAPAMIGLGLLEAVPEAALAARADADDRDGDGVSGRLNVVWDERRRATAVGRFGWKAEQPTVLQQTAAAFAGDMGITSSFAPSENHTAAQRAATGRPSGGAPEIDDALLGKVALYARTLAVPARRGWDDAGVRRGEVSFGRAGCAACHVPELVTGTVDDLPELSGQTIRPYTDLLLHDLGEELADGRPAFGASGREWRTPPLWGLGLVPVVNGHALYLHDGRARGLAEAVLWHGGEAAAARAAFVRMSVEERRDLLAFVGSL